MAFPDNKTFCCMKCGIKINFTTALYGTGMCHPCLMNDKEHRLKNSKALKKYHKKHPNVKRGKNNPMFGRKGKDSPVFGNKYPQNTGEKNHNWIGGKYYTKAGYVMIRDYTVKINTPGAYKLEHRIVMEKHLGRKLKNNEKVHHLNGIKDDNRLENLKLFSSSRNHMIYEKLAYTFLIENKLLKKYDIWFKNYINTKENIR